MTASFDERISRAAELSKTFPAAAELLLFYQQLTQFQKPIHAELSSKNETDTNALLCYFPALIKLVKRAGPEPLADYGNQHLRTVEAQQELLHACWQRGTDFSLCSAQFYARVLLQPYAEHLASRGQIDFSAATPTCPFCSAHPVVGVLRGEGDGASRRLICSLCSTEWPFRRVICPNCGEQDKDNLPVYTAPNFPHVRVDACDTCQTYIKSVDFTKDGRAVPVVDELATVALNIWAEDHGYAKLETNLLGM
jgi:FdhE protein